MNILIEYYQYDKSSPQTVHVLTNNIQCINNSILYIKNYEKNENPQRLKCIFSLLKISVNILILRFCNWQVFLV